jgi:hypothetical protein
MTPDFAFEYLHGLGLKAKPEESYWDLAVAEWVRRWHGTDLTTAATDGNRGRTFVMRDASGLWRKLCVSTTDTPTISLRRETTAATTAAEAWARMELADGLARVALLERQLVAARLEADRLHAAVEATLPTPTPGSPR